MGDFRIAILGCGTVGGGVARILMEEKAQLSRRAGRNIELAGIVDLFPKQAVERHGLPAGLFYGNGADLTGEEAGRFTREILADPGIDLVVETIGGASQYVLDTALAVLNAKKHLTTANKALLAKYGDRIFDAALANKRAVGFEASVCGAIPIIKGVTECFSGDEILSISGIMNGTSNYILSKMEYEGISFEEALKGAQEKGYAEADPTLDISGGDAGHKLAILVKLVFGLNINSEELAVEGIEKINKDDLLFAREIDCSLKLICHAEKKGSDVFATVRPMMVKKTNLLADVNGATNAVKTVNKYAGENIFIGKGAGSLETGSAIVSDIVFIARRGEHDIQYMYESDSRLRSLDDLDFPYNIIFETEDVPGITGIVATAIGKQNINIDTVSHNRHNRERAIFSIATMPCSRTRILRAVDDIIRDHPKALTAKPKIIAILR